MSLTKPLQRERMTVVHIRLPRVARETAKAVAKKQQVSESEIYRDIIETFLPEIATKCSNNPLQDVTKGGEPS